VFRSDHRPPPRPDEYLHSGYSASVTLPKAGTVLEAEALALSAAIEAPIAWLIVRLAKWPCRGPLHAALASAVATAVTHPQLWEAALWAFPRYGVWPATMVLEAAVILVEAALIAWMAKLALRHALVVSVAANVASCAAGFLLLR
jgi:hypothetical protein